MNQSDFKGDPMTNPPSRHLDDDTLAALRIAYNAIDTAAGCLMLVAEGVRITDLPECRAEMETARNVLAGVLAPFDA